MAELDLPRGHTTQTNNFSSKQRETVVLILITTTKRRVLEISQVTFYCLTHTHIFLKSVYYFWVFCITNSGGSKGHCEPQEQQASNQAVSQVVRLLAETELQEILPTRNPSEIHWHCIVESNPFIHPFIVAACSQRT